MEIRVLRNYANQDPILQTRLLFLFLCPCESLKEHVVIPKSISVPQAFLSTATDWSSHICMMVWPTLNKVICWSVKNRILFPGFWIIIQKERRPRAARYVRCCMTTLVGSQVVVKQTHAETGVCLMVQKLSPGIQLSSIQPTVVARAEGRELYVWKCSLLFSYDCGLAWSQSGANPMHLGH